MLLFFKAAQKIVLFKGGNKKSMGAKTLWWYCLVVYISCVYLLRWLRIKYAILLFFPFYEKYCYVEVLICGCVQLCCLIWGCVELYFNVARLTWPWPTSCFPLIFFSPSFICDLSVIYFLSYTCLPAQHRWPPLRAAENKNCPDPEIFPTSIVWRSEYFRN